MAASQSECALPLPANGAQPPALPAGAARGRPAGAPWPRGRRGGRAGGYCTFPRARPDRPDALWSGPTPLHAAPPPLPSGPQQLPRRRPPRHPGGERRDLKAAAEKTAPEASALPVPRAPPSDRGRLAAGPRKDEVKKNLKETIMRNILSLILTAQSKISAVSIKTRKKTRHIRHKVLNT